MNVLILGGGGREHALAWKIAQSPRCARLHCAPGNAGIAKIAECFAVALKPPFDELIQACRERKIDLVVVGPEDPLAAGVVDALEKAGVLAFGPRAAAAKIEASKTFAKEIMRAASIPTGWAETFTDVGPALALLKKIDPPYVVKADGLAAGKGVTIAANFDDAERAVRDALEGRRLGEAGASILIEERLIGVEASLLAFTDGRRVLAMDSAQDHKPVFDGDRGPNTGGMGAISPAPALKPKLRRAAVGQILEPAVAELARRGIEYRGVLYAGLMLTTQGPKVVEFNCRFGDPETQALMPRLDCDLLEVLVACARGDLGGVRLKWKPEACVCVVAASGGYPGDYAKGLPISGVEEAESEPGVTVFHAGTALDARGRLVTAGGRVLGVTAVGEGIESAREAAYRALGRIAFEGMHHRGDIGLRAGAGAIGARS
jgi:phosphoribosylamine--glycine ligase